MFAAIRDSVALPSVQSLCHSAAHSNLYRLVSETLDLLNRADPIFLALCLVLTNQSKYEGSYLLRPQIETSEMADLNNSGILKLVQVQNMNLLLAFSSLFNIATPAPAAKQHQMITFIRRLTG